MFCDAFSRPVDQTMSFSAFSAVTLTTLRAGLALNIISSPVKGLTPLRALVAGLRFTRIFMRPGTVNWPGPRRPMSFLMIPARASNTVATSFFVRPVSSAMAPVTSDLVLALAVLDLVMVAICESFPVRDDVQCSTGMGENVPVCYRRDKWKCPVKIGFLASNGQNFLQRRPGGVPPSHDRYPHPAASKRPHDAGRGLRRAEADIGKCNVLQDFRVAPHVPAPSEAADSRGFGRITEGRYLGPAGLGLPAWEARRGRKKKRTGRDSKPRKIRGDPLRRFSTPLQRDPFPECRAAPPAETAAGVVYGHAPQLASRARKSTMPTPPPSKSHDVSTWLHCPSGARKSTMPT